jgi:hypothetical protein
VVEIDPGPIDRGEPARGEIELNEVHDPEAVEEAEFEATSDISLLPVEIQDQLSLSD